MQCIWKDTLRNLKHYQAVAFLFIPVLFPNINYMELKKVHYWSLDHEVFSNLLELY